MLGKNVLYWTLWVVSVGLCIKGAVLLGIGIYILSAEPFPPWPAVFYIAFGMMEMIPLIILIHIRVLYVQRERGKNLTPEGNHNEAYLIDAKIDTV